MPITGFDELLTAARRGERRRLAVVGAEGTAILHAVHEASEKGIIRPVLIGDRGKIETVAAQEEIDLSRTQVVDEADPARTATVAVDLVRQGEVEMLMKGTVSTATLLKAVLDKDRGLRSGGLLSHVAVAEVNNYPKLMLVTDGGINIAPDLRQKVDIIRNAAHIAKKLGVDAPKVAVLAALETVNPEMQDTVDAAVLTRMGQRGQLPGMEVDGPLAFDLAISQEAAQMKGVHVPMAGEADIFLVPHIAVGNVLIKALIYLVEAKVGGVVVGAKAPIILLSRADSSQTKLNSIALGTFLT